MTDVSTNNSNSKPWFFKLHWQVLIALLARGGFRLAGTDRIAEHRFCR